MSNIDHSRAGLVILFPDIRISFTVWKKFAQQLAGAFTFGFYDFGTDKKKTVIAFALICPLDYKNIWKYARYFGWCNIRSMGIFAVFAF